jgi:hypothetical protein
MSAGNAFVYGIEQHTTRTGPIPSYVRVPADGSSAETVGTGSDAVTERIVAKGPDARLELLTTPSSGTLREVGPDGVRWSLDGAFFGPAVVVGDGSVIVAGRTSDAWSVQGFEVAAQTAFLMGVGADGAITWLTSVPGIRWIDLAASSEGVTALATVETDARWGATPLIAGTEVLVRLDGAHQPAGAKSLSGGRAVALAGSPDGSTAVLLQESGACQAVTLQRFSASLEEAGSEELHPADCAQGSVDARGLASSTGDWVVSLHALGAFTAAGQALSTSGADSDWVLVLR